ncbi:MAG: type VI secretion system tip protein VgrG [Fibrobacteres bacterium]|nr:type VI secretion system tip protein VgrG [Fibrobacterota bacterium]
MASADTSVFSFKVGTLPLDTFRVIEFIGQEAISECYHFTIRAVAFDTELKFEEGIGVAGTLYVRGADYEVTHYGIITAFTQVPDSDGTVALNFTYEFTLEPRVRRASYTVQSRIFQAKTAPQIVDEVLSDYLEKTQDYKIDVKCEVGSDYPKREFTVQYNESDLDFIQRLLEDEGICYFFDHSGDREVLIITNKKTVLKPLEHTPKLPFRPEMGMHAENGEYVDALNKTMRWMSGAHTVLKDYNYRTPETPVIGLVDMKGTTGKFYHYGDHMKTSEEAKRLAQIRAEMFFCQREIYRGTGIARAMQTGRRYTLEKADAEGFNGEYLLVRVTHLGDMGGEAAGNHSFEAIPAAVQFRPQLKTAKPKAPGILTAKVDGQKGSYAYIDEEGRYRMKLFFDRSDDKDGKASKSIRLAQPYAGAGYGMHFPLHTETEIAVGFVDGDLDRPIGLGALPNPSKGTPVKAGNKHQNMMKSHSGNSMILEDKEGATGIHFATSGGHKMGFDDSAGTKGFNVKTSGGHTLALDDKGQGISLHTTGGIDLKLDDKGTQVVLDTHGNTITMKDSGANINIKTASGGLSITMDGGGGKIAVAADTEIKLTVGASSLTMGSDGTIKLEGKDVTVKGSASATVDGGPKVLVKGVDAAMKGDGSANVSAPAVTVKADGALTLKGAMVSSEADAVNIVKGGAAVMLNP